MFFSERGPSLGSLIIAILAIIAVFIAWGPVAGIISILVVLFDRSCLTGGILMLVLVVAGFVAMVNVYEWWTVAILFVGSIFSDVYF